MSKSRSADASIRGYIYQFNKTIIEILGANSGQKVLVETIEDVDILSDLEYRAIQCKYLEAQAYAISKIRKALEAMLVHSKTARKKCRYILYAHFNNMNEGVKKLDIAEIKNCMKYKKGKKSVDFCKDNKITDADLKRFVSKFHIEFGPKISNQEVDIISKLRESLDCDNQSAIDLFYPRAFSVIARVASNSQKANRVITKKAFVSSLGETESVFLFLYKQYKGNKAFVAQVKSQIKKRQSLQRAFCVYVILEENVQLGFSAQSISKLIRDVSRKHFYFKDSVPWTFCISSKSSKFIHEVKANLYKQSHLFNDGGEGYHFNADIFNKHPLVVPTSGGRGSYIQTASFSSKVVSTKCATKNKLFDGRADSIFVFGELVRDIEKSIPEGCHIYKLEKCKFKNAIEILTGG